NFSTPTPTLAPSASRTVSVRAPSRLSVGMTLRPSRSGRGYRLPAHGERSWSAPGLRPYGQLLPQLVHRARKQSRDLHLRNAERGGDLRLRLVIDEAQHQHFLLALGQGLDRRAQIGPPLYLLQPGVDEAECGVAPLAYRVGHALQRVGLVAAARVQ